MAVKGGLFLSDGRFFRLYEPLALHMILSYSAEASNIHNLANLIAVASEIDDVQTTLKDILNLKVEDLDKVFKLYNS